MPITQIPFGRLGHLSTRTIFGGAALGSVSQADADRTLDLLLRFGINHIDVAASYGDAELRIAPWLKRLPDHFFLATKTEKRRASEARDELHRSLERMGVDRIDLWQLHNLSTPEEWEVAFGPGGVIEAAVEAREQGLTRGVGVTGHGLQIAGLHRRSLEQFDFDSVLCPYNYVIMQDEQYARNFEALAATCVERSVAIQTIKSLARGPWQHGARARNHDTWYRPYDTQPDIDAAVWWVLARPEVFLLTAGDIHLLPMVLDAAARFEPTANTQASVEKHLTGLKPVPLFS